MVRILLLLLVAGSAFGQAFTLRNPPPPTSSGASTNPATFSGLIAWWKADSLSGTLSDGGAVASWTDSSGSGRTATQGTAGNKPIFKTGIIGSMPVVRFASASSQFLSYTSTALSNFTVIVISKLTGSDSIFIGESVANVQFRRFRSGTATISKFFDGISTDQSSSTTASASTAITCFAYRRVGSAGTFRENTTSRSTFIDSASATISTIGKTQSFGHLDGDICEIVIYTNNLADGEVDSLYNAYFKPRWTGLP